MSKHKKSKRRHRERSHRRRDHKCHHRSWDSSSSTNYSPRYKRRRSYSPGKISDESRESSYTRESRSRSHSRDRSSSISKNTEHTPTRSRE
ncbi:arginine/serine-rich coiled-coil protein 2-like [Trichogramma pretiosum]|uniref:arginine/serine-rich coiled-coil protein 2-like n=1 Tax=Trichogramma pretiosum TaxID=7493 RepID=UPI000C718E25|nr:arginine/serine-rich coiled-coil protein 2-like [Trichogramma pretiosum]